MLPGPGDGSLVRPSRLLAPARGPAVSGLVVVSTSPPVSLRLCTSVTVGVGGQSGRGGHRLSGIRPVLRSNRPWSQGPGCGWPATWQLGQGARGETGEVLPSRLLCGSRTRDLTSAKSCPVSTVLTASPRWQLPRDVILTHTPSRPGAGRCQGQTGVSLLRKQLGGGGGLDVAGRPVASPKVAAAPAATGEPRRWPQRPAGGQHVPPPCSQGGSALSLWLQGASKARMSQGRVSSHFWTSDSPSGRVGVGEVKGGTDLGEKPGPQSRVDKTPGVPGGAGRAGQAARSTAVPARPPGPGRPAGVWGCPVHPRARPAWQSLSCSFTSVHSVFSLSRGAVGGRGPGAAWHGALEHCVDQKPFTGKTEFQFWKQTRPSRSSSPVPRGPREPRHWRNPTPRAPAQLGREPRPHITLVWWQGQAGSSLMALGPG